MSDILKIIIAMFIYNLLHTLFFVKFKADKYEDTLANKIADEVINRLKDVKDEI